MRSSSISNSLEMWSRKLSVAGIRTSRLDCLVLLEDATAKDRSWLLAHPEHLLTQKMVSTLQEQIERRITHEPLAYIRGKNEFYGRSFMVTPDTMVPRPESETIITLLHEIVKNQNLKVKSTTIIDVGTGSGCLAVTAKLEFPQAKIIATDISSECLKIAQQNARNLGAEVTFYQGDLLRPLTALAYQLPTTIILANLPYVPDNYAINQAAKHEPTLAIFGGPDGLNMYRKLFKQIAIMLHMPDYIMTESLPFQHEQLQILALKAGYELHQHEDLIQVLKSTT